jgi:glutamate synthase (NADPH) small chain
MTKEFVGSDDGQIAGLRPVQCKWVNGRPEAVPDSERLIECDMILIAIGLRGAEKYLIDHAGVSMNRFTFEATPERHYMTSAPGPPRPVPSCVGDQRGQKGR